MRASSMSLCVSFDLLFFSLLCFSISRFLSLSYIVIYLLQFLDKSGSTYLHILHTMSEESQRGGFDEFALSLSQYSIEINTLEH